jgi:lipopolysaccharide cholinephosphotransferase
LPSNQHADALHQALLSMLLDLDALCQEQQLPYQLAAGTLLGAVREGGIIGWDKDADICLLRSDFDRFMVAAETQLKHQRYFLQHHGSEPAMYSLVTKLRLRGSRRVHQGVGGKSTMHEGIAVDIFPFDAVQPHTWLGRLHMWLCANLKPLLLVCTVGHDGRIWQINKPWWLKAAVWLVYQPLRLFSKPRLMAAYQWLVTFYTRRQLKGQALTGYVACLVSLPRAAKQRLPRMRPLHSLQQTVTVQLHGHAFPAPHNYHQVLTNLYGDYLQPPPLAEQQLGMTVEFEPRR